jgi:outer membrane lipoprotein-sorting protein
MTVSLTEAIRAAALVSVVMAACGSPVAAQTAEELVAKNISAKGGMDNIKAVTNLRMTGKMETQGIVIQLNADRKPDSVVRESQTIQGMAQIHAYDGSEGWKVDPFSGRRDPERMGEEDTRDLVETYDFYGPFVDYQRKGSKIEYIGHTTVDGDDALLLRITLKNGDIVKCYLDPETYLEIRTERMMFVRGKVRQTFRNLGSYKKVNGVYFPFSIETGTPGDPADDAKLSFSKIEANVPLPDSEFTMPAVPAGKAEPAKNGTPPAKN